MSDTECRWVVYESRVEGLHEGFAYCILRLGVACFQSTEWIKKEKKSYKARTLGLQCYEVGEMKRKECMRLKARS